jgi:periplasmic divalent cation tolerance protein
MIQANDFVATFVTTPNMVTARKLASLALNSKLVACANLVPKIESHYWWEGKLESNSEVLVIFKTTRDQLDALEKLVLANHTYNTPEIICFKMEQGNEKYLEWIQSSMK